MIFNTHVAMQNSDSAQTRHRDCHRCFSHFVHRCRQQRHGQRDLARQLSAHIYLIGKNIAESGDQNDIVKGETFVGAKDCVVNRVHEGSPTFEYFTDNSRSTPTSS